MINRLKVIQTGLEPVTRSLEGCCSIQLSYWTILILCPPLADSAFEWAAKVNKNLIKQVFYKKFIKIDFYFFNKTNKN